MPNSSQPIQPPTHIRFSSIWEPVLPALETLVINPPRKSRWRGRGPGQRSSEKASSVYWARVRGPDKFSAGCRSSRDNITAQLVLKKGLQLNILLPYTLLGVMFPGWSFPYSGF